MLVTPAAALDALRHCGLRQPQILTIAITGSCNLACSHCWVGAGGAAASSHVPSPEILRIIDDFAALGGCGIRITGGEPLLHPDCLEFVEYAGSHGFSKIFLQTNGLLVTEKLAAALRVVDFPGLSIQISLDGAFSSSHDRVRGMGSYDKAMSGIKLLAHHGLGRRVTLFFTEMRHNLGEIPDLLELAERLGVAAVVTGALVRCGRASGSSGVAAPDPEQYRLLIERFQNDGEFRRRYAKFGSTSALEWHRHRGPRTECCTFLEHPYLTPDGTLFPCVLCHSPEFSVPDVFRKGLTSSVFEGAPLWSSLLQISRRRATTIPECRSCPEQATCAGGCMGRAWGSFSKLTAADDRCAVRLAVSQNSPL